jgi:hypothetical protein
LKPRSKEGGFAFMEQLSNLLNRPEYLHVAINHFPLIGLPVAMLALAIGLVTKSRPVMLTGLGLVAAMALSIWPVYAYGEAGFDRVLSMADEAGEAFLKYHAELAHRWAFLYYVTAGVATLGLGLSWKRPGALIPAGIAALLLGVLSLSAGIAIAHAGGEIRHREFRSGPPPASRAGNPKLEGKAEKWGQKNAEKKSHRTATSPS